MMINPGIYTGGKGTNKYRALALIFTYDVLLFP